MRNIFLLYCVALAGLCACESEEKVYPDGPGLNEVGMQIVLTDPELNDLLNPESPSFLGEEYTKGILVMYLNAAKRPSANSCLNTRTREVHRKSGT